MSLSTSWFSRLKIAATSAGVLLLVGCSLTGKQPILDNVIGEDEQEVAELGALFDDFATEAPPPPEVEPLLDSELADESSAVMDLPKLAAFTSTLDWELIVGGETGNRFLGEVEIRFQRPVALAVRGDAIYVVDAGLDAVLLYDRVSRRIEVISDLKGVTVGEVTDIFVAPDLSFYITDPQGSQVLHLDHDGDLLQRFRHYRNMVEPVAVVEVDQERIVIADSHYDHLLRFNRRGDLVEVYGARGGTGAPGEFLNIKTMAYGPDGYYVGARVGQRVQVISKEGNYLYSFEPRGVIFPSTISVDESNRSYVADLQDDTIKIFDRGSFTASVGGHGTLPGRFKRIADLWIDGQYIYVADSLNGRIQIAHLKDFPRR